MFKTFWLPWNNNFPGGIKTILFSLTHITSSGTTCKWQKMCFLTRIFRRHMGGGEWEVKRCMWFLCLVEHFQAMRPVFCCGLTIRYARGYFYSFRFWICMNIWKGHNWTMIRNLGTHNKPEDSSGVPGEHRRSTGAPWVPSAWQSLTRRIGFSY